MSILKNKVECGCEKCWASIAVGNIVCECDQCWLTIGSSPRQRLEKTEDDFILQRPRGSYTGELRPRSIRVVKEVKDSKVLDATPSSRQAPEDQGQETRDSSHLSFTIEDLKKEVAELSKDIFEGFAALRNSK